MGKKKSAGKTSLSEEDAIHSLSVYLLYQSANMPQMVSWAKKVLKKQDVMSPSELFSDMPKKHQKFLHSIKPSAYKNLLLIVQAVKNDLPSFIKQYALQAPEFRDELFAMKKTYNIDLCMRSAMAEVTRKVQAGISPDDAEDENGFVRFFFMKVVEMCNGSLSSYQIARKEMKESDIFPFVSSLEKGLTELFLKFPLEEIITNMDDLEHLGDIFDAIMPIMSRAELAFADYWKVNVPKRDVQELIRIVCATCDISEFEDEINELQKKAEEEAGVSAAEGNPNNTYAHEELIKDSYETRNEMLVGVTPNSMSVSKAYFDLKKRAFNQLSNKVCVCLIVYRFILLYRDAMTNANKLLDENIDLKIALKKELENNNTKTSSKKEKVEKNNQAETEMKQRQLNELQRKYDKLILKCQELESKCLSLSDENQALQDILEGRDDEDKQEYPMEEDNKPYPKGTILFGGHENWQRKFSSAHPEVRVLSGVDENFPENVVSNKTPLVLLNTRYMNHKVFYKIRQLQKKQGWEIKYLTT